MSIKPLRDIIVAVPCEEVGKVGLLHMPDNHKQALATHRRMLVLAAGPEAVAVGCESGAIIHASERWGESLIYNGRTVFIGRIRDINGICPGEEVEDRMKYMD